MRLLLRADTIMVERVLCDSRDTPTHVDVLLNGQTRLRVPIGVTFDPARDEFYPEGKWYVLGGAFA